jgi:hypothetical protein
VVPRVRTGEWVCSLEFHKTTLDETVGYDAYVSQNDHAYSRCTYSGGHSYLVVVAATPDQAMAKMWAVCDDLDAWSWNDAAFPDGFGPPKALAAEGGA